MSSLARQREKWFFLLISPWLIGFILFMAGPILLSVLLSLTDWQFTRRPEIVGASHYQELLRDPLVAKTLFNSLYYALGTVPTGLVIGLGLALLVNNRARGMAFFRTVYFLPAVISGVATTLMWGWVFNPRYGMLNTALSQFGIQGPAWLQDQRWAMPALIVIGLWTAGTNMVVYLAALQGIPEDLREAAALDGAGALSVFRHITLPLIAPVTFYLLVVNLIGAFQVFTPAYLLTQGGPNFATLTLPLYIYLNAFSWGKFGYAASLASLMFALILAMTFVQFRLADRWVIYLGREI